MKWIFQMLIGCIKIPQKLIKQYDVYEWLKNGNFTLSDVDIAYKACYIDSNYGKDKFYSVFLNNEFDKQKCPLCY